MFGLPPRAACSVSGSWLSQMFFLCSAPEADVSSVKQIHSKLPGPNLQADFCSNEQRPRVVNCLSFQGAQEASSSPRAPSFQESEACDETSRTNHDPVTYSLIVGEGVTPRPGACAAGLGWVTPVPFLWLALWDGGGYFPFSRGGSVAVLVPQGLEWNWTLIWYQKHLSKVWPFVPTPSIAAFTWAGLACQQLLQVPGPHQKPAPKSVACIHTPSVQCSLELTLRHLRSF